MSRADLDHVFASFGQIGSGFINSSVKKPQLHRGARIRESRV